MPSLSLFFYCGALALAWLFRLSYRGWFAPVLFWALLLAPLLALLLSLPTLLTMRLTLETKPTVTRNQSAELRLRFSAKSLLPVGSLRLRLRVDNRFTGESLRYSPRWYALREGSAVFPIPTARCGALVVSVERWDCFDLLGLFSLRRPNPDPVTCAVLPTPREPDHPVDFEAALQTFTRLRPKYGGGFAEEHELREYRPGDMSNAIHWKLSSKADKLIVREALEEANKDIFLLLSRAGKDDRGLEVLYWLSLELLKRELPHRIAADSLYTVGNEAESVEALTRLLSVPLGEPCPFDPALARRVFRVVSGEVTLA